MNRKDKDAGSYEPPIDEASLPALKAEWLRIVRDRAANGSAMLSETNLINHLYRWRDFSGSFDEPKAWVSDAVRSDEGFVVFVTRMMSRGTTHGSGDRVSVVELHFNRDTVENFIGVDVAKARLDRLDRTIFAEYEEALATFDRYLSNWLGKRHDDLFGV